MTPMPLVDATDAAFRADAIAQALRTHGACRLPAFPDAAATHALREDVLRLRASGALSPASVGRGTGRDDSFTDALIVALVLALLNTIIKPILVILTFPITIITLGLFLLVINAIIILLADKLVDGFDVAGFWSALLFSILLSIITSLINASDKKE